MTGMTWKVRSVDGGRWFAHDGTAWTADDETTLLATEGAGMPIETVPHGHQYRPTSKTDPLGLYLLARYVIPAPHIISGEPPLMPTPPAGEPGRVY